MKLISLITTNKIQKLVGSIGSAPRYCPVILQELSAAQITRIVFHNNPIK